MSPVVYNGDTNNLTGNGTPNPKLVIPQKNAFDPPTLTAMLAIEQWCNNLTLPIVVPPVPVPPPMAYVANNSSNTVTPITVSTGTPGTPITVGTSPYAIAVTPDGSMAYVVCGPGNVYPIT